MPSLSGNVLFFAPPGRGKSLRLAMECLDGLKIGRRWQMSNFPMIDGQGRTSRVWTKELVSQGIRDADIYWDEIQLDYPSGSGQQAMLPPEDDEFWATTGQAGNRVFAATQGVTRVAKAVRDRMHYFVKVDVMLELPFLRNARGGWFRPVLFRMTVWDDFEKIGKKGGILYSTIFRFRKDAAMAYDTTWFAGQKEEPPDVITWKQRFLQKGGDYERFEDQRNKIRQARLWPALKRAFLPQEKTNIIYNLNFSTLRVILGRTSNKICNLVKGITKTIRCRIFPRDN